MSIASEATVAGETLAQKAGKYLTFQLGLEVFGLEILKVQEIIGIMPITRIPRTPNFVRGVINLRGKVIPVIDLRRKFDLSGHEDTNRSCIIVVQLEGASGRIIMGLLVDEVSEVLNISADKLENTPEFGPGIQTDFIMGMGKIGNKVVMLLDVDRVLASGDLIAIENLNKNPGV
jgi:purine-binding chemotaxis protein CheW